MSFIKLFSLIGAIAIAAVLMCLPLMLLWNWLMPEIFGLIKIDFWQALGLAFLSTILFKNNESKKD